MELDTFGTDFSSPDHEIQTNFFQSASTSYQNILVEYSSNLNRISMSIHPFDNYLKAYNPFMYALIFPSTRVGNIEIEETHFVFSI